MYKIIGGDKKEYGPVSADQVRQWLREGRANGATLIQAEGTTDWKPLSAFPEFADAVSMPALPAPPPWSPEACLARDYDLDIGKCLTQSWELVKENLGILIGATLVLMVINFAAQQVMGLFTTAAMQEIMESIPRMEFPPRPIAIVMGASILMGPLHVAMYAGLYLLILKLIRGEDANFSNVFAGFGRAFPQLLFAALIMGILSSIGFFLCIIPGIYLSVCWFFTAPLILDRKLNFWDAMELSRKKVHQHWLIVFCFILVSGLISALGVAACCVGIVVSIPVAYAFMMYAYEDIFRS